MKCAQWPPKELTVSFRIGDVDMKLQLTYRRRKKIWKRKTWSRTYDFIQKTIEMLIGSVGRDRSCYKIALLIRREWFPRLKIQQKRKWLQSYLTDHSQSVQIDGFTSSVHPLRFGVPQGFAAVSVVHGPTRWPNTVAWHGLPSICWWYSTVHHLQLRW